MTRFDLNSLKSTRRGQLRLAFALLLAAACLIPIFIVHAASPSSGTLNPTTGAQLTWTGTASGSATGVLSQETDCVEGTTCDTYTLNVSGNPSDWTGKIVHVEISWTVPANDYDLYVHKGSNGGAVACSLADTSEPESCDFRPSALGTGTYTVHVVYSTVPNASLDQYHGLVKVNAAPPPPPTPPPAPVGTGAAPRFQVITPQPSIIARSSDNGLNAGEPSIGSDWKTGAAMFISDLTTFRVTFDDSCLNTTLATWLVKNAPNNATSLDPILYTDHGFDNVNPQVGRTFSSQLSGTTSLMSFTDDDGETWTPSQGGSLMSGVDHQTVGGGPFHAPLPAGATYPNAIYYCSQDVGAANCALSVDGGATFGPAVPIYSINNCTGLHGHIKVGPDGTAYVPNRGCGGTDTLFHTDGNQAAIVSEDNGATWNIRAIPNSQAAAGDPAVTIGKGNKLYFAYANSDIHPAVAVSDDHGVSWHNIADVGVTQNIQNVDFPAITAGDNNRAAYAFLGSTTAGDGSARDFPGLWHVYVSTTYDGGASWQTVDVTPNDPVQRYGIWRGGGSPVHRNLLDFIGIDVDKQGRVLVAYADGCAGAACVQAQNNATGNAYTEVATIARQTGGRRLFAINDPANNTNAPGAPYLVVGRDGGVAHLSWSQSDDGGSAITGYKVFRTPQGGSESPLVTLGAVTSYDDTTATANVIYTYRVVATNSVGDSCGSNAVTAKPQGDSCTGLTEVIDPAGDQTGSPANADLDIQTISVADEVQGGVEKITFKMKVADLSTITPNRQWRMLWNYPVPPAPAPGATPAPFTGQYYVGANSDGGALTFEYGTVTTQEAVPADLAQPNKIGDADSGSLNQATGVISVTISASKVGSPKAGDIIGKLVGRTFAGNGNQTLRSTSAADTTGNATQDPFTGMSYMLTGNTLCGTSATPTPTPTPTATPSPTPTPTTTPTPPPPPPTLQFSQTSQTVNEDAKSVTVTVTRAGDTTGASSVDFTTDDTAAPNPCSTVEGKANQRCDYTTAIGTLNFAAGETSKTFSIFITDDNWKEGDETFTVSLHNPVGGIMGTPATATITILDNDATQSNSNPIDVTNFFVRMQYIDFLYREPDQAGFNDWTSLLNGCANRNNSDPNSPSAKCDRTTVSSNFFRSDEFQIKGYFVHRFYRVAFARIPTYLEFIRDLRRVTGATAQEVNASKDAYTNEYAARSDFHARYDSKTNDQYVDALQQNVGVTVSNSQQLKDDLNAGRKTRADVLRAIVESNEVGNAEFNGGFIAAEYFGYLRRDPDTQGFNNWMTYLTAHPGDYRTMVYGFVNSDEYRLRFGKP
jgi:hypothetical protein